MGEQDVECRRPCAALHGGPPARNSNTFALVSASIGQLALYSQPPPDACDATRRCAARASSWSAYGVRASVNRRTRVTQNVLCSPATGSRPETVGVLFPRQVTRRPDHRIVDGDRCRLRHARRCPSPRRRRAIAGPRVDVAQIVAEALAPVQQLGQQRCATPWVAVGHGGRRATEVLRPQPDCLLRQAQVVDVAPEHVTLRVAARRVAGLGHLERAQQHADEVRGRSRHMVGPPLDDVPVQVQSGVDVTWSPRRSPVLPRQWPAPTASCGRERPCRGRPQRNGPVGNAAPGACSACPRRRPHLVATACSPTTWSRSEWRDHRPMVNQRAPDPGALVLGEHTDRCQRQHRLPRAGLARVHST